MTVRELKNLIDILPDDMEVIIQKDGEGNDFSPLAGVDYNSVYIPENTWSGNVCSMDNTAEEECMSDEEWEEIKSKPLSLVLYPVN